MGVARNRTPATTPAPPQPAVPRVATLEDRANWSLVFDITNHRSIKRRDIDADEVLLVGMDGAVVADGLFVNGAFIDRFLLNGSFRDLLDAVLDECIACRFD